jgi:hypothetical protein
LALTIEEYVNFFSLICTITIALSALRSALIVMLPVAPGKSFVVAIASRIDSGVSLLARPMASARSIAAS